MTYTPISSFRFWCQKVLPLVYDDSLSYYEVLCKLVDYLNKMIDNEDSLWEQLKEYGITIEELKKEVAYLSEELEKVKNGEYVSLYIDSLKNYIDNNLQELVGRIVKYVFFGLTMDGHFCAYIPETWDFISFDTIIDSNSELYGHLVLRW